MMSAGVSVVSVLFITLFIVIEGVPLFFSSETGHPPPTVIEFLLGPEWFPTEEPPKYGILPFIVGSLMVTAGALVMAVPIGVSVGIYVAEIAGTRAGRIMRRVSELLAAIPSVIYGFVGLMMIGFFLQRFKDPIVNYNAFSAMLVLAVMTLPTIINITEVSIRSVPEEFKNGALAIGSTHWQTIWRVILPSARGGVITGIILGMGRAVGETMAVLMVAGNQPTLPMDGLRSRVRTLTMAVVNDMGYAAGDHRVALFATAIVLFLFVLSLNLVTQIIAHRSRIKVR
jgi:phosphate transport system permease protein